MTPARDIPVLKMQLPQRGAALRSQFGTILAEKLPALAADEYIVLTTRTEQTHAYRIAERLGIKITTRKLNGTGFGVWRVQ